MIGQSSAERILASKQLMRRRRVDKESPKADGVDLTDALPSFDDHIRVVGIRAVEFVVSEPNSLEIEPEPESERLYADAFPSPMAVQSNRYDGPTSHAVFG